MDDPINDVAGSSEGQKLSERAVTPYRACIPHGGNRAPDGYGAPLAVPIFLAQRPSTLRHHALAAMLATWEHLSVPAASCLAAKAAIQLNTLALNLKGAVS